ncbi:WD40/YVTN/BNR-like repeat-containing protein [Gemmatimonadota bacterium]
MKLESRFSLFATVLCILGTGMISDLTAQDPTVDPALFQDMEWRNIGPFRGGRSVAVAGVVQDHLTYYFGGVGSGVWKTKDAGITWSNVSDTTFGTSSVGAIAVAESDPNVVYVGMGEHPIRGVMTSHGDGVYKSTDAGRTWSHMGLDRTRHISDVMVHPSNSDLVYVAAQGAAYGASEDRGVYRSRDGGATWEKVLYVDDTSGPSSLSIDRNNPRVLYAAIWDHRRYPWQVRSGGPGSGIHKTTDGGDTWAEMNEGLPELMGDIGVAVSASSDRVYAIVEADPGGGLYRSDDAGKTWRKLNESWSLRARAWYYTHIIADPSNADIVWIMNAPVSKSIDGGRTFNRVPTPHGDNHDLWINPSSSDYMINANDGGANVSLNGGGAWSTQGNQPTAQFYRVNTDNRFPYYVYGGQQDNSSVAIVSRASGGISWKDWYVTAGCETAYLAFDPDNPVLQYGGCYMGQISEFDERTGSERNIMAYPHIPLALASRDMKYRFNWSAPIVASSHNPNVIYHAANVLLKTEDRGETWVEVSPDLTRDEDEKQGPGGGPITNEGAGGEIYGTIYYVAESPHDAGTIWTGSDDGLVHVTRDGGANWLDVTPEDVGEALINAIEVSPHDPAVAYVTVTRYKFNDFTPHIYRTNDYGESWDHIVDGIAYEAWARVVREDPVRRGLLYAGTEKGLYVSWNDGDDWQSLQLNMPLTPITDLKVQVSHNDLVAATGGRAFWILDDLSPLQQIDDQAAEAQAHLFEPHAAYRVQGAGGWGGPGAASGKNPPDGAIVDFILADVSDSAQITLEFLNGSGEVVRSFSTVMEKGKTDSASVFKVKQGHNRFAWDLRHENVMQIPGLYLWGSLQGRRVMPGSYEVRLSAGDEVTTQRLEVLADPRVEATARGFQEQNDLIGEISLELEEIHEGVLQLRSAKEQVEALLKRLEDQEGRDSIKVLGKALVEKFVALEDSLIQNRTVDGQTVINFPSRLNIQYVYLRGVVDGAEGMVTDGSRRLFSDLSAIWDGYRAELRSVLGAELNAFNALVREENVPAVVIP